jgi:predicted permease
MTNDGWRRVFRFWDAKVEHDVDAEFAFHFAMRVEEFMAQGMTRDDAERAAHAQFGNENEVRSTLVDLGRRSRRKRDWRDAVESVGQDIVVALRALRREPLFAIGVILTLGLGIGANATIFGIVDGLMLRGPAHVSDARRVQRLYVTAFDEEVSRIETSAAVGWVTYAALRDRAQSFAGVGAYGSIGQRALGTGRDAPNVRVASVTADLFPTLGVRPRLGRFFLREEDQPPRGQNVAVISEQLWTTEFAGAPSVLGARISLAGENFTIVGVAPAGFAGVDRRPADVWVPMSLTNPRKDWPTTYYAQWMRVVARLKPGVASATASAEATTILRAAYDGPSAGMREQVATVRPLWFGANGEISPTANVSRWLMAVAAIVLLITCANVANLLLARATRRRREVAVRLALGASRGRVARFLFAEIITLAVAGIAVSMLVALLGGRVMRATLLSNVAWESSGVDLRVFSFALVVALVAISVTGAIPGFDATRMAVAGVLKSSDRGGTGRRGRARVALSILQSALCVVLLVGAALFVESLRRSQRVSLGFDADRVIRVEPRFPSLGTLTRAEADAERTRNRQTLLDAVARLRGAPEIANAAVAVGTPFGNSFALNIKIPGRDSLPRVVGSQMHIAAVTPEYFATVGTPLRRGRVFTTQDVPDGARVAIVNETMAATFWQGEDAIGKCFSIESGPCATIVGIVSDVHQSGLRESPRIQYYVPFGQECCIGGSALMVRTNGDPTAAMARLRQMLLAMPAMPRVNMSTMQSAVDPQYAPWKLGATMFGVFGGLALIVAAVGLYSVIAYLVSDRTRELGVRIALGASKSRILREVLVSGLVTTAVGVALGVGVALSAARFVEPMLFEISAKSPAVYASVAAVVLVIAALAAWSPARRASRVDPVIALRAD